MSGEDDARDAGRAVLRAATWCRAVLGRLDHPDAPEGFAEAVAGGGSLSELVGHIDRAG